jgi:hypothetical protein
MEKSKMEPYIAPRLILPNKRLVELPFSATIPAGSWLTILTSIMPYKFRIMKAKMVFGEEANNLVQHSWFISHNTSVSITGYPSGDNIFAREMTLPYFIGKGIERVVNCNIEIDDLRTCVKLCTYNLNAYPYIINCMLTIQEM